MDHDGTPLDSTWLNPNIKPLSKHGLLDFVVDFPSYKPPFTVDFHGFPTFFRYFSNDFQGISTAMMTCLPCQDAQLKREEALLGGDMCKNPARCDFADLATPQAESVTCRAFRTGDSQHDPPCHKHGRDSYTYIFIHTYYIYTICIYNDISYYII